MSSLYNVDENSSVSNAKNASFSVDETIFEHTIDDRIDEDKPNNNDKVEKWLDKNEDLDKHPHQNKTVLFADLPSSSSINEQLNSNGNLTKLNCLTDSTNKIHNNNAHANKSKSSIVIQKLTHTSDTIPLEDQENDSNQENLNLMNANNNNSAQLDGND